jgi:hypothetical protein
MISSPIRRQLCVLAATGAVMGIGAPAAGAATFLPANHDFGNVAVGATSPQQAFVLTNGCAISNPIGGGCLIGQFTSTVPVNTTGDFAVANDDCPDPPFGLLTTNGATCTANVTIAPTAAGPRNGTVTVGGFSAILTGTGVAPASPGGTVSPGAGGTQGVVGGKKRCKKGKSAVAAKKKCKRKKK